MNIRRHPGLGFASWPGHEARSICYVDGTKLMVESIMAGFCYLFFPLHDEFVGALLYARLD